MPIISAANIDPTVAPKTTSSPTRVRSRDAIDGRPRGVLSKFGVSRVRFRNM
ncbi:MAG: hypothetical protein EBR26_04110, partial [Microbacteriaceae bacterium]|nr:hypothetical protein [Microbacteriaceae bacterium]